MVSPSRLWLLDILTTNDSLDNPRSQKAWFLWSFLADPARPPQTIKRVLICLFSGSYVPWYHTSFISHGHASLKPLDGYLISIPPQLIPIPTKSEDVQGPYQCLVLGFHLTLSPPLSAFSRKSEAGASANDDVRLNTCRARLTRGRRSPRLPCPAGLVPAKLSPRTHSDSA